MRIPSVALLVALVAALPLAAIAEDVAVRPAPGDAFVVRDSAGRTERLRVEEDGDVFLPALVPSAGADAGVCVDTSTGALGSCPLGSGIYENVITVAKSGGDFASVAEALTSITDASASNRYLVQLMPGVYSETDLVQIGSWVHLRGSGANVSVISSARTAGSPTTTAATVWLLEASRLSDLTVQNTGTGSFGIALYSTFTTRATVVENVVAEAIGVGGIGHYAAYWSDAEAVIRDTTLFAGGATGFGTAVNAAFASVNVAGAFPAALIEDSILIGGSDNSKESCTDATGTGFGIQMVNSSPMIRGSSICGGHRGIVALTNGSAIIHASQVRVSTTASAFLFDLSSSASISVGASGVSYTGNKATGAGTNLRCVHAYNLATFAAVSNGTTTATACN